MEIKKNKSMCKTITKINNFNKNNIFLSLLSKKLFLYSLYKEFI